MQEEWRDIAGYEGLYQVSNLGRVRSLDRRVKHNSLGSIFCRGCLMRPCNNRYGYPTVNLSKDGGKKRFTIHRLVAQAFIPNPNNLPEINHKDEGRTNNHVDNLEWCTALWNNTYGTKVERQTEKNKKRVLQYDLNGNFIREWACAVDAEKAIMGKVTGAISHNIKGKSKTAFGYIWRYKEAT